jgi:D-arabinose 1-dehydrogenase-like Zn-dependent alcohol dehydrogenase
MKTMLAARLHELGAAMRLEQLPVPEPGDGDVLVEIKACGIVPNLRNVLRMWSSWFPYDPLPKLPAIFGLDAAGVIARLGDHVQNFRPGDRVYVNPFRHCGCCRSCRSGQYLDCQNGIFQGYFGFGPEAQKLFDKYPYGGLAEFQTAPAYSLVKLPDQVTFEQAARFGYLGTAYGAYRKANLGPGDTLLINGISGTLGLGAALIALAMGVPRILGTARDAQRLAKVKALAPDRIEVLALGSRKIADWARELTDGLGVDVFIDCLGPGSPPETMVEAIYAVRRGGKVLNVGGMGEIVPMDVHWMMDKQISFIGSCWFNTAEAEDMAAMARAGTLDLSVFEHKCFPLSQINDALDGIQNRNGGFTNFVMIP